MDKVNLQTSEGFFGSLVVLFFNVFLVGLLGKFDQQKLLRRNQH